MVGDSVFLFYIPSGGCLAAADWRYSDEASKEINRRLHGCVSWGKSSRTTLEKMSPTLSAISVWSFRARLFAGSDGSSCFAFVEESYLADILELRYIRSWAFSKSMFHICARFAEHVELATLILLNHAGLTGNQRGVNLELEFNCRSTSLLWMLTDLCCNKMPHCVSWYCNIRCTLAIICDENIDRAEKAAG